MVNIFGSTYFSKRAKFKEQSDFKNHFSTTDEKSVQNRWSDISCSSQVELPPPLQPRKIIFRKKLAFDMSWEPRHGLYVKLKILIRDLAKLGYFRVKELFVFFQTASLIWQLVQLVHILQTTLIDWISWNFHNYFLWKNWLVFFVHLICRSWQIIELFFYSSIF